MGLLRRTQPTATMRPTGGVTTATEGSMTVATGAGGPGTGYAEVVRMVMAPSEIEARTMVVPVREAFIRAGWRLMEDAWIPGDRRVGLGESLLLGADMENLLEADGTLRLSFRHPDPTAVPPLVAPLARQPDRFEELGGVRYRRIVPRIGLRLIVSGIAFLIFLVFMAAVWGPTWNAAQGPGLNGVRDPGTIVFEGREYQCTQQACTPVD